jgi:HEPN domain-containing protein
MLRDDFQDLSRMRIREAKVLLDAGEWAGSYYLAGYSVECAMKACIAKKRKKYEYPDKELANACYQHDLTNLLRVALFEPRFSDKIESCSAVRHELERRQRLKKVDTQTWFHRNWRTACMVQSLPIVLGCSHGYAGFGR